MRKFFYIIILAFLFSSCSQLKDDYSSENVNKIDKAIDVKSPVPSIEDIKKVENERYNKKLPSDWGEKIPGVITKIETNDKIIVLTFDACGGGKGNGYDAKLIDFLINEKIPATFFINSRWIDANHETFMSISRENQFEIENHGLKHKPLSVNGKSAYGINGTNNIDELIDEIMLNGNKIEKLTGKRPKYFRSGTNYYDDIAVKISSDLGIKLVSYDILGDAGATYNVEQIKKSCTGAKPGSIIIFHMNQPNKNTAKGVMAAIPELRKIGYKFVKLEDYDQFLK